MILPFKKCSQLTGKSISTIYRAIKNGLISASFTEDGKKGIEISELSRVFPIKHDPSELDSSQNEKCEKVMTGPAKHDDTEKFSLSEVELLKDQIAVLKESLADTKETLSDTRKTMAEMKIERNDMFQMLKDMQIKLLPAPESAPSPKDSKSKEQKQKRKKSKKKKK